MSWGIWVEGKRKKRKRKGGERRRKGSSTDAKVFQFSTLKHDPTPQLHCPRRLLNKTLIRENTVACVLSGTVNFNTIHLVLICMYGSAPRKINKGRFSAGCKPPKGVYVCVCTCNCLRVTLCLTVYAAFAFIAEGMPLFEAGLEQKCPFFLSKKIFYLLPF